MAGATDQSPPLRLDSIPTIDLRLLSQSELYSLSMTSNSSFELNRCDDVIIPKINRSVFNESAGSRKQTYLRLRLAPPESSRTTIHRRTPHISSSHAQASTNVNDPEQAENSQIIRVLKELFRSDPNFEDLVPIEVETDATLVMPELSNPEIKRKRGRPRNAALELFRSDPNFEDLVPIDVKTDNNVVMPELSNPEIKRKRGRPRKHESAVFIRPPAAKRRRNDTVKKVVVSDDDRDREIMNSRCMKVNIMNLGRLEDPYGPEIRRRTEGMSTEDDLLGFLRGLNGRWGTKSEKKRVVDASDFGDALPKGWMLSLSIKKKEGRVWLFCRRYVSPSGRQFKSCKEASVYLLSLVGEENLHKPSHTQSNDCDDLALKGASDNAADLFVCEDVKRNGDVHNLITPSISIHMDCEKQVKSDIVDPVDVQIEELFKCLKCFMIFEGKVDYLDHQTLAHKAEKSQLGSASSEWAVVKGGIFECQFCAKTFYERNQYNGHIRIHVTNENEIPEASKSPAAENVERVLETGVPDKLPVTVSTERNVVIETHDAHFGDKSISASPESDCKISSATESTINAFVHDLNTNGDALVKESGIEIGNKCNVDDNIVPVTDKASDFFDSKSGLCSSHEASMPNNESNGRFESSSVTVDSVDDKSEHVLEQGTSSGGCLLSPSSVKRLGVVVEKNMVVMSDGQDSFFEAKATHVDKPECLLDPGRSCEKNPHSPSSNELMGTVGKNVVGKFSSVELLDHAVSETRVQPSGICEKRGLPANIKDAHVYSLFDELTSEKEKVVNSESSAGVFLGYIGLDEDSAAEVKECSVSKSLSLGVDTFSAANNASLISCVKRESSQTVGFAGSTFVTSGLVTHVFDENIFSCARESCKVEGQDEFRRSAFDSYSMNGLASAEKEDNFTGHSLWREKECVNEDVGSMEKPHIHMNVGCSQIENDVKTSSSNKLDDFGMFRSNENSLGGLDTGDMAFNSGIDLEFGFQDDDVSGLYESAQESTERVLLDHFCVADERGSGIHELSLTFGNPDALYAIGLEQKKDKNEDVFNVQTNLSMFNNSMVERGRESYGSSATQHNTRYPGRLWQNPRPDEFEEKKFMMGSGSNQRQQHSEGHAPNYFHSFDIMSNKADKGVERSEPVEFRFLTTSRCEDNSSNNVQGIGMGMEAAYWMGNSNSNSVLCAWCRNVFPLQVMAAHAGVGPLCPTCSAAQINML